MGSDPAPEPNMKISAVLSLLLVAAPLGAALVIDDAALNRHFSASLGELAEDDIPIQMNAARQALHETSGKPVIITHPGDPIVVEPDDSLYSACLPAIVAVGTVYDCGRCDEWHLGGFATGWIASPDGIVVTNHHVIQGDETRFAGVMTPDGSVYPVVEVLGGDEAADIAVIRIDTGGEKLPYLALADDVAIGEKISVISNPRRRFFVYTSGVVSRFQYRPHRNGDRPVFMSITADYAVGSSGAPVINSQGRVVGMAVSTSTATTARPHAGDNGGEAERVVQMVFKDSISLQNLRETIRYKNNP